MEEDGYKREERGGTDAKGKTPVPVQTTKRQDTGLHQCSASLRKEYENLLLSWLLFVCSAHCTIIAQVTVPFSPIFVREGICF